MPLLPAEPYLYPENLFAESEAPSDGFWWVLHTRPRAEKALRARYAPIGSPSSYRFTKTPAAWGGVLQTSPSSTLRELSVSSRQRRRANPSTGNEPDRQLHSGDRSRGVGKGSCRLFTGQ